MLPFLVVEQCLERILADLESLEVFHLQDVDAALGAATFGIANILL